MKHLKKYKVFESENFNKDPEILSTVNEILLELSDDGFEIKTKYWIGGKVKYNKIAENIEIHISKNRKYVIYDIIEVYNRLCIYLESEGFKKDLLAENGEIGSIPHLSIYEFISGRGYTSVFSFSALSIDYNEYLKKYKSLR